MLRRDAVPHQLLTNEQLWDAWERVRENAGCAGSDGVARFSERAHRALPRLIERVNEGAYRPFPLLKIVVEKHPGRGAPHAGTRTLLVPTVADRVLQTAVARHLSRSFEEEFLECSYGYRPGRSVDRAIARIRKCRDLGYVYDPNCPAEVRDRHLALGVRLPVAIGLSD